MENLLCFDRWQKSEHLRVPLHFQNRLGCSSVCQKCAEMVQKWCSFHFHFSFPVENKIVGKAPDQTLPLLPDLHRRSLYRYRRIGARACPNLRRESEPRYHSQFERDGIPWRFGICLWFDDSERASRVRIGWAGSRLLPPSRGRAHSHRMKAQIGRGRVPVPVCDATLSVFQLSKNNATTPQMAFWGWPRRNMRSLKLIKNTVLSECCNKKL